EVIEGLSDSDVNGLLLEKWTTPLISELMTLPNRLINELTTRLENIVGKYRTTFEDVEYEILKTERELSAMLGDLRGNEFDMKGIDELRRIMNCE
ncbi:MAG: type I restriction-modification system subunit M, partial [Eubacterium sp.]|nr:type I restriction-modification system subunit M [Eubacterium sp.]